MMATEKNEEVDWMEEEIERAEKLNKQGQTNNNEAPEFIKVKKAPSRMQKNFFMKKTYVYALEDLETELKRKGGKKMPELIEEAVEQLLKSYGVDISKL
jgi:hypothetical protein